MLTKRREKRVSFPWSRLSAGVLILQLTFTGCTLIDMSAPSVKVPRPPSPPPAAPTPPATPPPPPPAAAKPPAAKAATAKKTTAKPAASKKAAAKPAPAPAPALAIPPPASPVPATESGSVPPPIPSAPPLPAHFQAFKANTLSPEEQRTGWTLLFNGRNTEGWRGFGKEKFPERGWVVEKGWLKHLAKGGGGDIVTFQAFSDFELQWEWKIAQGGNSGLKYFIDERRGAPIGHEYQMIDDLRHPDAAHGPKRQTGSLYDVLPVAAHVPSDAGLTHQSRLIVRGDHVEHWLNGDKVLEYELGSAQLLEAKASSKFKNVETYGTKFGTRLLLQDHGDEIWVRNIKVRRL